MSSFVKVATTQFALDAVPNKQDFWSRVEGILKDAKTQGAELIVFPEYFSVALMMCELGSKHKDFHATLHNSQSHSQSVVSQMSAYAMRFDMAIVVGTIPWIENAVLTNRSFFIFPNGKKISQDKIFMTRFENQVWHVNSGEKKVQVFDWKGHKTAILTCYDSEFAVLSQTLGRAGVELLLVPSCTDTEHGYWRVRHCCESRAIENQVFVVMSSIVGGDKRYEEINEHYGRGAIFSPCDTGFPPNGVLAEGSTNKEGIAVVELNFDTLQTIRKSGSVLNLRDLSSSTETIPWAKR